MNYKPDGHQSVIPYIMVKSVDKLLDFLVEVFEAKVTERMARPDGSVMHASVTIDDSVVMMGEPHEPQFGVMPASLYIYVRDTDATYKRGLAAGAVSVMEPADQFYGDRNAGVKDSLGNVFWIGTHFEDVAPEELERRAAAHQRT